MLFWLNEAVFIQRKSMAIRKMELAWITVSDFAKAKKFFVDTLGLTIFGGNEQFSWLELRGQDGGMLLGVGGSKPNDGCAIKPGQNAVMTFTVDDMEQTKAALEAKGVVFASEIIEIPGIVKMALFTDTDGNKFQLVENLEQNQ